MLFRSPQPGEIWKRGSKLYLVGEVYYNRKSDLKFFLDMETSKVYKSIFDNCEFARREGFKFFATSYANLYT